LWTLPLTTPYSVIEASFIPSLHGRAAHTGGKPSSRKKHKLRHKYKASYQEIAVLMA
jgi:hypothetical protein